MTTIRQPWGLSVFGSGSVRTEPQFACVKLEVDLLEQTPDRAFERANKAVAEVRQTLRGHGIADGSVSGSRLRLHSAYDGYGVGRTFLGYRCQAAFTVETTALNGLQQLIVDVVDAGANHVEDVVFDVHDKSALRDEARHRAVEAARRKAAVYAEATGVKLGPVVHVEDVDPESVSPYGRGHGGTAGGRGGADLAPGMVEVAAGVHLGFALTH
ncbi:SIMPL domain-containing protein [Streptomyces sp. NPDC059175]|uniref:SIMPL domain-containing protein n=1 Tax=unclassified Streptomyces TaxID=2593676 RepID=UPI0036BA47F1